MVIGNIGRKTLLVLLALSGAVTVARGVLNPNPNTVIPKVAGEPKGMPETWKGASVIRIFTTDNESGNRQIEDSTMLHLRHDGKNLYAGWRCSDSSGEPVAFDRTPMDNLMLDESVQIVMGTPGESKRLDMGGYAGAQGVKLAPVSHYYELTANAVGSVSRSYNETLLPNPHFSVETFPMSESNGWYAIMTIPWEAAGIDPEKNPKIYFNAFRFNHSIRYGWLYPAFGNYTAMPFGKAVLTGTRVVEPEQVGVPVPTVAPSPVTTDAAIWDVEMEYYPLSRTLIAVFPADAGMRSVVLEVPALGLKATSRLNDLSKTVVRVVVPKLEEGTEIVASAGFVEGEEKTEAFKALDPAEWYGTDSAVEYVDKVVPYPWSTPVWTNGAVRLAHGAVEFGDSVLPRQITVKNREILRAPISARIKLAGKDAAEYTGSGAVASAEPTRVDLRSPDSGMVEMRNMVDFDGFMVWRLRLNGVDARNLEELTLTVPLAPGVAKYVNRGNLQSTVVLGGQGYTGNKGPVWVGGESIGLGISNDRKVYFSPSDGHQIQVVKREDGEMDLVLRLVTAAGQVPTSDQVFQLLLLPTPTRAESPPPAYDKMRLLFEKWSDYQAYPDLTKLPMVKKTTDAAHAGGARQYLYFGQVMAENSPAHEKFANEIIAPPRRPWYRRSYEPGKGVPCSVSCFRGATGDLLLEGVGIFAEEAGIDGVYLDGVGYPFGCTNPSHDCDADRPVEFDDDVHSGRIIGHRQFLKRLRGIFDARGEKYPIWAHNGGGLTWNTLSLADYLYEGEQLARYRDGYLLSPEQTLVGYSGKAFGFRGIFLPHIYARGTGLKQALAWSLVHDMEISLGAYKSVVEKEFFSLPRRDSSARFYPYWEEQEHLERLSKDNVYVSYYRSTNEAMIVAVNLRYDGTQQVELGLEKMFGVPVDQVEVVGIGTGKLQELKDSRLDFALPEGGFRVFRVRADGVFETHATEEKVSSKQSRFRRISGYNKSDWKILYNNKEAQPPKTDPELPMKLVSVKGGGNRAAIRTASPLPANFTAKLKFCHEGTFRLQIGDFIILMDAWEGWRIAGTSDGDPWGVCNATQRWPNGSFYKVQGEVVPLEISIKDGRITLKYNGRYMLDNVLLEKPQSSYNFSMETWGGLWLKMGVDSIKADVSLPREKRLHPVY